MKPQYAQTYGTMKAFPRGKLIALSATKKKLVNTHQQLDNTPKSSRTKGSQFTQESYSSSQPARKDTTNQNLLRQSFIAYSGAREEECGRKRQRGRESEMQRDEERGAESRGREQRKRRRERDEEAKRQRDEERECQNPVPFKENYPPPRTCHSLIGCSPSAQLSSRERQSTWRENCPCTCADYLLLRTQLSAPSCNGKCECGSPHLPLSF